MLLQDKPAESVKIDVTQTKMAQEWKHGSPLVGARFDPAGRFVFASAQDNSIQRWQLSDGKQTALLAHQSWVRGLTFAPKNNLLFTGDYHGKVIDAETLQPIEGAVAIGVWSLEYGTVGGPVHEHYDARETLTDQNGEFSIKGMGPRAVTHLRKMKIVIFKAGYEHLDKSSWEELQKDKHIKWENGKAIIPLSKLSLEQRRKRWVPYISGDVPMEKQKRFREEMKKEIDDIHK